jgi:hypothetical protein
MPINALPRDMVKTGLIDNLPVQWQRTAEEIDPELQTLYQQGRADTSAAQKVIDFADMYRNIPVQQQRMEQIGLPQQSVSVVDESATSVMQDQIIQRAAQQARSDRMADAYGEQLGGLVQGLSEPLPAPVTNKKPVFQKYTVPTQREIQPARYVDINDPTAFPSVPLVPDPLARPVRPDTSAERVFDMWQGQAARRSEYPQFQSVGDIAGGAGSIYEQAALQEPQYLTIDNILNNEVPDTVVTSGDIPTGGSLLSFPEQRSRRVPGGMMVPSSVVQEVPQQEYIRPRRTNRYQQQPIFNHTIEVPYQTVADDSWAGYVPPQEPTYQAPQESQFAASDPQQSGLPSWAIPAGIAGGVVVGGLGLNAYRQNEERKRREDEMAYRGMMGYGY